jgi:hypothetical protein
VGGLRALGRVELAELLGGLTSPWTLANDLDVDLEETDDRSPSGSLAIP